VAVAEPVNTNGIWEPGEQQLVSVDTYDKRGDRAEHVSYTPEGTLSSKIVFTYDDQGNETEATWYNASGTPESRAVSTYDAEGHKTETRSYTANETLTRRTVFTYDTRGNETAAHSYTPEDALENSTVSTYDANGNLEEAVWSYVDGKQGGQIVYKRDAKGTLLSSVALAYAPDGTLQSRMEVAYDARGNPTEVAWYSDNGKFKKSETSTYRYDTFGNWTQRTTTKWVSTDSKSFFEPPAASYRTFTYYGKGGE
jgi:antitoxin component YwqK of YwqJK toxin-antitoxin module